MKMFSISHTTWKRANFYHRPLRTRGKTMLQNFWTNSSILSNLSYFGFSQIRKNFWQNQMLNSEQPLACSVWIKCTDKEKQTPSTHHGVWGGHKLWWCYVSIHLPTWPKTQHGSLHQAPGMGSADLDWEGGLLEDPTSGNKILHHATPTGKTQSWLGENFCFNHITPTSGHLTPQIVIPLITMCQVC